MNCEILYSIRYIIHCGHLGGNVFSLSVSILSVDL